MSEFTTIINNKMYNFSGFGASNWQRSEGKFIVKSERDENEFETLVGAWKLYVSIDSDVELLDATIVADGVLIEKKEVIELNEKAFPIRKTAVEK